jgi:adenylate cyclase class IV
MQPAETAPKVLRRNLELKARCADLIAAQETVRRLGAVPGGLELQVDTYFIVPKGRLKLREITGQPAVLIWYDRPNQDGVRASGYYLAPVPDPLVLRAALASALGVRGEVHKERDIYLWQNVRIHLDEVAGLGSFLELEAVLSPMDDEAMSRARLEQLCRALAIETAETEAASYADLLGL